MCYCDSVVYKIGSYRWSIAVGPAVETVDLAAIGFAVALVLLLLIKIFLPPRL
jgi:hypothetical protein